MLAVVSRRPVFQLHHVFAARLQLGGGGGGVRAGQGREGVGTARTAGGFFFPRKPSVLFFSLLPNHVFQGFSLSWLFFFLHCLLSQLLSLFLGLELADFGVGFRN